MTKSSIYSKFFLIVPKALYAPPIIDGKETIKVKHNFEKKLGNQS